MDFSILLGGYELNETLFSLFVTMADEKKNTLFCKFLTILDFTHICREFSDVAIFALYPESFCVKNPATRKVFAFSDSVLCALVLVIRLEKIKKSRVKFKN